MSTVTLFDLLGISAGNLDRVVARWPAHAVQGSTGKREHPEVLSALIANSAVEAAGIY